MAELKRQRPLRLRLGLRPRQSFLLVVLVVLLRNYTMLFHETIDIGSYLNILPAPPLEADRYRSLASASTSLASRQSYEFFNDIPDRNWKYMQENAERTHNSIRNTRSSRLTRERESFTSQTLNSLQVRAYVKKNMI
jgi:hypothetical protein